MEIQFIVEGHSYKRKAGKAARYKVSLKSTRGEGHRLTLVSGSKAIWEQLPEDMVVDIKIGKAQRTLDDVPGHSEES